ncbi:9695_t:CDS:1 [Funneliformis geosporum]|uniref:118_t:CDS:1 n=1 Tax=Funneliformis geosporum TaxID=1117311 RepID=A0A9W4WKN4_9GLOM|nr:9695_t:CDS:1 [Funneliformis geosporum]CAI2168779.1 118_t:CDS:1 [Funneliformis geosporum]
MPNVHSLPENIFIAIFRHVPISQLHSVSRVCREWSVHAFSVLYHRIFITPSVWSHFMQHQIFQKYSSYCKELIVYSINLTEQHKSLLLEHTHDLNNLALLKCHNLDEDFLYDFTNKHSTTMEKLILWGPRSFESGVTILTDGLLRPSLPNMLNVRHLSICAANISDEFLLLLVSTLTTNNVPSLIGLDLTECWKLTAFGVAELFSNNLSSLRDVTLQYHKEKEIDVEFFEFLASNFATHRFEYVVTKNYLRYKVLIDFDKISRDLNAIANAHQNVTAVTRENVWTDDEIVAKCND